MTQKQESKICIYCGGSNELTEDHIPPKNLFPKPRPNNLITVPCCRKCNTNFSKDDEYFRLMLLIREDTFENESVQKIYPTILRSLKKPNKIGFSKSLVESTITLKAFTKAGLFIGYKKGYKVDLVRLERIVGRIVRGLFFSHEKMVLPFNVNIMVYLTENIRELDAQTYLLLNDLIRILKMNDKDYSIGSVIEYKYVKAVDKMYASLWLIQFYQKISFLCFINE